jgi:hypothetical protein
VAEPEVGTVFGCTSNTEDGDVIKWQVTVDREDHVEVQSQNVLLASNLEQVGASAVTALYGEENPLKVTIDCGERSKVLDLDDSILCDAYSADDLQTIHDAKITSSDLDTGTFEVDVSDEPRP